MAEHFIRSQRSHLPPASAGCNKKIHNWHDTWTYLDQRGKQHPFTDPHSVDKEYVHPQSTGVCGWSSSHEQDFFRGICYWWAWCTQWRVPKQHKTKTIWTFTPIQLRFGQATSCIIEITFTESNEQRFRKKCIITDETLFFAKSSLRNYVAFFILCKVHWQTGT